MSVLLTDSHNAGGPAAQTGNLVHSAAAAFHTSKGDRVADGLAALQAARAQFPDGDPDTATDHAKKYFFDPANAQAEVVWCEQKVSLVLPADESDPTGQDIHIIGTLDQVRREPDGTLRVWDIKTGKPDDALLDYMIQQSVYTIAARACLDPTIQIGGLILTKNYFISRARTHCTLPLDVDSANLLVSTIPFVVAGVRRGLKLFKPSPEACRYCEVRPYPNCTTIFNERFR